MNSLSIIGNLGSDAEVRYTKAGKAVATFSVAVTSGWGENKKTTWIRCSLFGDRAEKVSPYILKGDKIGVTGEIELQEWQKQDGTKGHTLCCFVRDLTLMGDKSASKPQQKAPEPAGDSFDDDTIPF